MPAVWIKLEGVLSAPVAEGMELYEVGEPLPTARAALDYAQGRGDVTVYGSAAESIRGQRRVMRWLVAHDLYAWVEHEQTPPEGAEVIDAWPIPVKTPAKKPRA